MARDQAGQSRASREQWLPRWLSIVVMGRNPRTTLVRVAVLVLASFVVFKFILLHIQVEGISMMPTYQDGSKHFVNRLAYLWRDPQRGDVVGIRLAGVHRMFLKRIIGLPGETVAFEKGRVLINGEVLDEPYEKSACDWYYPPVKLGADEYFAVGDNRTMAWTEHRMGRVDRAHIVGKAIL
jgi:signal peptidase I